MSRNMKNEAWNWTNLWNKRENDDAGSWLKAYLCGTAEVIIIHLFYRLEVDHTLQLGLMFICGKENNASLVWLKYTDNDRLFWVKRSQSASLRSHLE